MNTINLIHRDIKTKNIVVNSYKDFESENNDHNNNCLDIKLNIKLIDFDFVD